MDILKSLHESRDQALRRAWEELGASPGPGPDVAIIPQANLLFTLRGMTDAGKGFLDLFYLDAMLNPHEVVLFKRHLASFGMSFIQTWDVEPLS